MHCLIGSSPLNFFDFMWYKVKRNQAGCNIFEAQTNLTRFMRLLPSAVLCGLVLFSSCKKSSDSTPSPNDPNNNNPNTGDAYKDGLPEVITGVDNGVESFRYTITEYNSDNLPTKLTAFGLSADGRGSGTAIYNTDHSIQSISFISEAGKTSKADYSYQNGKVTSIISTSTGQTPDTLNIQYDASGRESRSSAHNFSHSAGSNYYYNNLASTTYTYETTGRLTSSKETDDYTSTSIYTDTTYTYHDSSSQRTDYLYNPAGKLTQMVLRSRYSSQYDAATFFYYIDELNDTRTDRIMKNSLLQFAFAQDGRNIPPPFVAKDMGIGVLLQQSAKPTDPYVNPFVVAKTTIDTKPTYKLSNTTMPSSSYVTVKMK